MIQIDKNIDLGLDKFHEMRKRIKNFQKRQMQEMANAYADPNSKRPKASEVTKEADDTESDTTSLLKASSKTSNFGNFVSKASKSR